MKNHKLIPVPAWRGIALTTANFAADGMGDIDAKPFVKHSVKRSAKITRP